MKTDFLVIGSGVAGLLAALKLQQTGSVLLVTKRLLEDGATDYAQGGIAAVTNRDDSFSSHISDTLKAGAGLCERGPESDQRVRFVQQRESFGDRSGRLIAVSGRQDETDARMVFASCPTSSVSTAMS